MFDGRFAPRRGITRYMNPHTNKWYEKIYEEQKSYYYPWCSQLPKNHGEDSYFEILKSELNKTDIVLDIGCGSGELTNKISRYCKKIIGYDRVKGFVDIANSKKTENSEYIVWDSKEKPFSCLPYDISKFTWVISSKGPLHWIEELPKYLKCGCKLLMLVPYYKKDKWNDNFPDELLVDGYSREYIQEKIKKLLQKNQMNIEKEWIFEVEEIISNTEEFYKFIIWGKYDINIKRKEIKNCINNLFDIYNKSISVNHCRYLWKSKKHRTTVST